MSRRIIIQFASDINVHRMHNFGEALFRTVAAFDGTLTIAQIDIARDRLEVTDIHARKLNRLLAHVRRLLAEHNMDAEIHTAH